MLRVPQKIDWFVSKYEAGVTFDSAFLHISQNLRLLLAHSVLDNVRVE